MVWKDLLLCSNVVLHTDNDAVRDSFIACPTTSYAWKIKFTATPGLQGFQQSQTLPMTLRGCSLINLFDVVVLVTESNVRTSGQHMCARLNVEKMGEAKIQPCSSLEKMLQLHLCEGQQMEIWDGKPKVSDLKLISDVTNRCVSQLSIWLQACYCITGQWPITDNGLQMFDVMFANNIFFCCAKFSRPTLMPPYNRGYGGHPEAWERFSRDPLGKKCCSCIYANVSRWKFRKVYFCKMVCTLKEDCVHTVFVHFLRKKDFG